MPLSNKRKAGCLQYSTHLAHESVLQWAILHELVDQTQLCPVHGVATQLNDVVMTISVNQQLLLEKKEPPIQLKPFTDLVNWVSCIHLNRLTELRVCCWWTTLKMAPLWLYVCFTWKYFSKWWLQKLCSLQKMTTMWWWQLHGVASCPVSRYTLVSLNEELTRLVSVVSICFFFIYWYIYLFYF